MSKRTLGDWGIGEAEVLHWLSRTDSAPVLRAAAILEASLREPPKEVLEIITLLTYASLGDDASEGSVVRHFRRWAGVKDMEVILGVSLDEIGPYLTNLYLAGRFAKGQDARIWLRKLLSSPVAMMLVSRAMAVANPPDRRRLQPSESNASNDQLAADRILMQRGLGSGDLIFFDFARSTPAMAWAFSRVMFDALFSAGPDNGWMQLNRLGFIEWVRKKNARSGCRTAKQSRVEATLRTGFEAGEDTDQEVA